MVKSVREYCERILADLFIYVTIGGAQINV